MRARSTSSLVYLLVTVLYHECTTENTWLANFICYYVVVGRLNAAADRYTSQAAILLGDGIGAK